MPTAIIAGASGLTGSALLKLLLACHHYQRVYTLERRTSAGVSASHHPLIVDFKRLASLPACDDAYCCLGTTIKKAGSQDAFRKVDFDYVVNFARAAKASGAKQFLVVSALGASANSGIFYNRVKGEMEEAVAALGFDAVHIFQPSFLLGERAETRVGERIGIRAFNILSPLLIGGARKYRPIAAADVAKVMLRAALDGKRGVMRLESDAIQRRAKCD